MRVAPAFGLVFLALTAGCASVGPPPDEPSQPNGGQGNAAAAASPDRPPTGQSSQPEVTRSDAATSVRAASRASPSATRVTGQKDIHSKSPNAKTPATIAQLQEKGDITPAEDKARAVAPLDLISLEQRLKGTNAIGVFTKLSLKNQVNELLDRFRAYHKGNEKTPSSELRQRYDLLLLKVLSLLQDSDPSLAAAIVASREAIWSILTDPKKFATLASDGQEESWANA